MGLLGIFHNVLFNKKVALNLYRNLKGNKGIVKSHKGIVVAAVEFIRIDDYAVVKIISEEIGIRNGFF